MAESFGFHCHLYAPSPTHNFRHAPARHRWEGESFNVVKVVALQVEGVAIRADWFTSRWLVTGPRFVQRPSACRTVRIHPFDGRRIYRHPILFCSDRIASNEEL
jgi:hypothetical protein